MAAISLTTHIAQTTGVGEMIAAHFREIAASDDAEFGRQRLEQHGNQIGEQDDPQQGVAVFRASLDIGREITGVHVRDRGHDRRAGKGQIRGRPPALAAENGLRSKHRAIGHRLGFRRPPLHQA
jgi:hypothetical protein